MIAGEDKENQAPRSKWSQMVKKKQVPPLGGARKTSAPATSPIKRSRSVLSADGLKGAAAAEKLCPICLSDSKCYVQFKGNRRMPPTAVCSESCLDLYLIERGTAAGSGSSFAACTNCHYKDLPLVISESGKMFCSGECRWTWFLVQQKHR